MSPRILRAATVFICLFVLGAFGRTVLAAPPIPIPPEIVIDGSLDDEGDLALAPPGQTVRRVFQPVPMFGTRKGVAKFMLDTVPGILVPEPDGFRDEPLSGLAPLMPSCALCVDTFQATKSVRSPFNAGKATIIYIADSDGFVDLLDPTTDDSFLYVGVDIANGDTRVRGDTGGTKDLNYHAFDVQIIDNLMGDPCDNVGSDMCLCFNGLPDLVMPFRQIDYLMPPFDSDGDGDPNGISRRLDRDNPLCKIGMGPDRDILPLLPEVYIINIATCPITDPDLGKGNSLISETLSMTSGAPVVSTPFPIAATLLPATIAVAPNGVDSNTLKLSADNALLAYRNNPNTYKGPLDIEFLVTRIDSYVQKKFMASEPKFEINRMRLASGAISIFADTAADTAEDRMAGFLGVSLPQIEVKKEIRCFGESDSAWRKTVQAVQGSTVEFRITVENTGNVDLATELTDSVGELLPGTGIVIDQTSLTASLTRPNIPPACQALGCGPSSCSVNAANAQCLGLNPTFFTAGAAGFLASINNDNPLQPKYLGVLKGTDVCVDPIILGDKLELRFRGTITFGGDPCGTAGAVDLRNSVRAIGDPDIPGDSILGPLNAPNGNETQDTCCSTAGGCNPGADFPACDPDGSPDTPRETAAGVDDNVVTIDLKCRGVDLHKEVRLCPSGTFVEDANCDGLIDTLNFTPTTFPLVLEYRYRASNLGQTAELVKISDPKLGADVAAVAGVCFATSCAGGACSEAATFAVASAAGVNVRLCPGDPEFIVSGFVQIDNAIALSNFLLTDDADPCPGVTPDPFCYTNCATAEGSVSNGQVILAGADGDRDTSVLAGDDLLVTLPSVSGLPTTAVVVTAGPDGILQTAPAAGDVLGAACVPTLPFVCPGNTVTDTACATICAIVCRIEVTKKVRCADDCATPLGVGSFLDTVQAFPNSCIEFQICIRNNGTNDASESICKLEIKDFLDEHIAGLPNRLMFQPGTISVAYCPRTNPTTPSCPANCTDCDTCPGQVTCTPPADWVNPYIWTPGSCPGNPNTTFRPNDILRIRFFAKILDNSPPSGSIIEPVNAGAGSTANTTASPDDVQCVASGAATTPGQVIILPGPNGVLNTAAAGNDIVVPNATNRVEVRCVVAGAANDPTCVNFCCTMQDFADVDVETCELILTKDVKCAFDANANGNYAKTKPVVAGALVTYRIRLCNKGTIAINKFSIKDLVECVTAGAGCCDPAQVSSVFTNIASNCTNATGVPVTFSPPFAVTNNPGAAATTYTLQGGHWLDPGESLIIIFNVPTSSSFATKGTAIDCRNTVTLTIPPDGIDVEPADTTPGPFPCGFDCPQLMDDATVNVLVPMFTFDKLVDVDCLNNGGGTVFDQINQQGLTLCKDDFPVRLRYKYKITNIGETSLNVQSCDSELLVDACATVPPVTVVPASCSLCGGASCCAGGDDMCTPIVPLGPDPTPLNPNSGDEPMDVKSCDLIFTTPDQFINFASRDSNPPISDTCTYRYTNRGTGKATIVLTGTPPNNICLPAVTALADLTDDLTVRLLDCMIAVDKTVRCIDGGCQGTPGPSADTIMALPGSCVEFCVKITDVGLGANCLSPDVVNLAVNDVISNPADWTINSARLTRYTPACPANACDHPLGGIPCPPPVIPGPPYFPFNLTINPLDPSCGAAGFKPGECFVLTFRATLSLAAATQVVTNTATVTASIDCSTSACGGSTQFASCSAADTTTVDVKRCAYDVEKLVKCKSVPGAFSQVIDALPGSTFTYRLCISNTGIVPLAQVKIRDCLTCNLSSADCCDPNEIANITTFKVSPVNCLAAGPGTPIVLNPPFKADCVEYTYGINPPINANESLIIEFDITTNPNFSVKGTPWDCRNTATVTIPAPAGICSPANNPCGAPTTVTAEVNLKVPMLMCDKRITADYGNNGSVDRGPADLLSLDGVVYPLKLTYTFDVTNNGELPINAVKLVDPELVKDACAAGASVTVCSLCDGACCPGDAGDTDVVIGVLGIGLTQTRTCEIVFANETQFNAFADQDGTPNDKCYDNTAMAMGDTDTTGVCPPAASPTNPVLHPNSLGCSARVCSQPCPFYSTHELDTKGEQATAVLFDPKGEDPPELNGGGPSLQGDSTLSTRLHLSPGTGDKDVLVPELSPEGGGGEMRALEQQLRGLGGGDVTAAHQKGSLLYYVALEVRWNANGDLIRDTFFSIVNDFGSQSVRVKWYFVNGDSPLAAAHQIPGDDTSPICERTHPGWNKFDNVITLTHDEPNAWQASTGRSVETYGGGDGSATSLVPFIILDPGSGDPKDPIKMNRPGRLDSDPNNYGGRVIRGFALAFAVDSAQREIRWNHLRGGVTIIDYRCPTAWAYDAWAFRALTGANGAQPDATPGQMLLNGQEYDAAPDFLLAEFFAAGSLAFSQPGKPIVVDGSLTLMPPDIDLRSEGQPLCTDATFDVWNEDEAHLTNMHRCFCCWDQQMLSSYTKSGVVNYFLLQNLGTNKGKACIAGLANPQCPDSFDTPLIGIIVRCYYLGTTLPTPQPILTCPLMP